MTLPITLNTDSEFMDFDTVESQVTQYPSVDWTSTGLDEPLCDVTNNADSERNWQSAKTTSVGGHCKSDKMKERNNNCVYTRTKSWHTCGSSCLIPKRPSMLWNTKYRLKEERKKILKISVSKLRQIEDPEYFLRRSVLINNTTKRLQQEVREEKQGKYTGWYYSNHYARIRESFSFTRCDPDEVLRMQFTTLSEDNSRIESSRTNDKSVSDELNDISDPQDLLSQFYIPSITNSLNEDKPVKRMKVDSPAVDTSETASAKRNIDFDVSPKDSTTDLKSNEYKPLKDSESWLSGLRKDLFFPKDADKPYSCGQSSLCELQSVVFHSLITSLES